MTVIPYTLVPMLVDTKYLKYCVKEMSMAN